MHTKTVPPAPAHPAPGALGYNLAGIAVLVLLLAVGVAYAIDMLGRTSRIAPPDLADTSAVAITVAGKELAIPASWFRNGEPARGGFVNEVDLRVLLAPAGASPIPVAVTLLPRSRARPSSALLDGVYLHQFGEETLDGVPGLVGKPLHDGDGVTGETVWYDPLSAEPFAAKCLAPITGSDEGRCVRTVYLPSGIAAVYAFDASALPAWRQFDDAMQAWLGRIAAL